MIARKEKGAQHPGQARGSARKKAKRAERWLKYADVKARQVGQRAMNSEQVNQEARARTVPTRQPPAAERRWYFQ